MLRMPMKVSCAVLCVLLLGAPARAEVLQPQSDAEVIETLPGVVGHRAEERKLRQQWAASPRDPVLAAALARRYLDQAREQGEPRFAGRALAALQR